MRILLFSSVFFFNACLVLAAGNLSNESFSAAKKMLASQMYHDHSVTLYCGAVYDSGGEITLPEGFSVAAHAARAARLEWEHVLSAENMGRFFQEWRQGHPACVKGAKQYRGRRCAEKVNSHYRLMQADMYNLYPSIGAVNALRSNFIYAMLPEAVSSFGQCAMKVARNRAEPPERARGQIARTYFYMAEAYSSSYRMSHRQRKLMRTWNSRYPVDAWECARAGRIERLQGNENRFVKQACLEAGLWAGD